MMKRWLSLALCLVSLLALCACGTKKTAEHAAERAAEYAQAVNYDYETPERIYAFLTEAVRAQISQEDFCAAFAKDRTYPYITPLYLFYPEVTLEDDGSTAQVVYQQAARIIGMTYTVRLVYENGDYYVEDWAQFIDGSYLEKFEDCPYTLDWYYDVDTMQ